MRKLILMVISFLINLNINAQCDSLDYQKLLNAVKTAGYYKYIKFSFDLTSEDSTTLVYARCPWQGDKKCLPYQEYLLVSKVDYNYRRFHCYDKMIFEKLQKEILAKAEVKEIEGKPFKVLENSILVSFLENPLDENECNLTTTYFIEFLIQK